MASSEGYSRDMENPSPVIIHLDVDAFECQVYERLRPDLIGQPIVVAYRSGRIVSVNYEAKKFGISRDYRIFEAEKACKSLFVQIVENHPKWGKADKELARHSSWEILDEGVLPYRESQSEPFIINFASCDEFFFDVTKLVTFRMSNNYWPEFKKLGQKTILEGKDKYFGRSLKSRLEVTYRPKGLNDLELEFKDEVRLMHGAIIAQEISQHILDGTKFKVSAGVGHNMLTAKLGTGLNKPQGITVVPADGVPRLVKTIQIENIPGLGGERGRLIKETFGVATMSDLQKPTVTEIASCLGEELKELAEKIKGWSYGICTEKVEEKIMKDRINCGKTFPNKKTRFQTYKEFVLQIECLVEETMARIEQEKYRTKRLPISLKIVTEVANPNEVQGNQITRSSYTFDWHDLSCSELLELTLEGVISFKEGDKFKDITRLNISVTCKSITSLEHAILPHTDNSNCKLFIKHRRELRQLKQKNDSG